MQDSRFHTLHSNSDLGRGLSGIAYLADPSAVNGAATLFTQKRAVDRYAIRRKLLIKQYIVDSGARVTAVGLPYGLHALLCAARKGDASIVFVEHISRFSTDYAVALRIAATLSSWGCDLHEACGGVAVGEPGLAARFAVAGPSGKGVTGGFDFERAQRSRSSTVFGRKPLERIS